MNRRPVRGPWGGGSKILDAIVTESLRRGHEVFYEEQHSVLRKVDVIFCMDPRPSQSCSYEDLLDLRRRSGCPIVQRVGDLGTHGKPELFNLVLATTKESDFVVFPSNWAMNQVPGIAHKSRVIPNGADPRFLSTPKPIRRQDGITRIVTHHWSDNKLKGFDVYEKLSSFCASNSNFEFTYIGRTPPGTMITNHMQPLDVDGLVTELPRHDVYVTASKWEAGANHVLEAMACGLPVLFHEDGGSIVEYCREQGTAYKNFNDLILQLMKTQNESSAKIFTRTTSDVGREYVDLLEKIS